MAVAVARGSGSLSVFTACSPSKGSDILVQGEALRADTLVPGAGRGGLVLGGVCWLVGVSVEATAVPLVAIIFLSLWT